MADDKQSGNWGSSFIVVAFAAVSALYVAWQRPPLISTRPTDPQYHAYKVNAPQDVDARLWQDPFNAVTRDLQQRDAAGPPNDDHLITEFAPDANTLALGVTFPGGPYPEAAETRRRLRYAVLAALHTEGYARVDEKHIGYFRIPETTSQGGKKKQSPAQPKPQVNAATEGAARSLPIADDRQSEAPPNANPASGGAQSDGISAHGENENASPLPKIIPYEQFENTVGRNSGEQTARSHVIVLWLDEDFLTTDRKPLASLNHLRLVMSASAQTKISTAEKPKFALLGPEDSTMMVAMAQEAVRDSPATAESSQIDKSGRRPFDFTIYNFGATADDEYVRKLAGTTKSSLAEVFLQANLEYRQLVNPDRDLAEVIAAELRRRGHDLKTSLSPANSDSISAEFHRARVALISEWDTVYGEYLPKSVAHAFGASDHGEGWEAGDWVTPFRYLRGLDGRLPDLRWTKDNTAPNSDRSEGEQKADEHKSATPDTAVQFEGAEGESQFDYVRRLAAEVKDRDADLRRTGQGHFAAIGVLGSDVYDKLLILQALRPEFPEALFFTTDLDALLLPQNKTRYTRNLLVASSFGLTLAPKLQADIPPFRSTYQTSIFRAARLAIREQLSGASVDCAMPNDRTAASGCWQAQPVLFQIGRSSVQELPSTSGPRDAQPGSNDKEVIALLSAQPDPTALFPQLRDGTYLSFSLLLAALLLSALLSSRKVRKFCVVPETGGGNTSGGQGQLRCSHVTALFFGALFFSVGFWLSWPAIGDFLTQHGSGEPMSLLEGLSLWPTIGLRIVGAGLSVWLICFTLRSLEDNKEATYTELKLPPSQRRFFFEEWKELELRGQPACVRLARITSLFWRNYPPSRSGERPPVSFSHLGSGFSGDRRARCTRAGIATLGMFILGFILTAIWGQPNVPVRGALASWLYFIVTLADVFATIFLIFLVTDASLFSRSFIKRLTAVTTVWPPETVNKFHTMFGLEEADLADWTDMQYLAKRTSSITYLIYFPFLALAVLIISRSEFLDSFSNSWTLIIVQLTSIAVVIGSVIALRATAENARTAARESLSAKIVFATGTGDDKRTAQLEMLLARIDSLNDGAFAPWSSQPIVKAVLLPLLTYSGTFLVHIYALPGS
jgi:hypothetical protein